MDEARNAQPYPSHTFAIRQAVDVLDSGWQTFPGHYLLYAATGAFHLDFERVTWYLPPQRAAWIAAGTKIRIWADKPVTSRSVLFFGDVREPALAPCRVFAPNPLAEELLAYVMRWDRNHPPSVTAERFFLALGALCNELAAEPERFWLPRSDDPAIGALARHIQTHLNKPLTAHVLAQTAHMSVRSLARRFQAELGMTHGQYVHRVRMLRALELLEQPSLPVTEVSWAVGFESLSAFTAAFKAFAQETPTQYRRRVALAKPALEGA